MSPKILIYGAGVIGSVYATRFAQAGCDVTVVARGDRLEAIRGGGLRTRHAMLRTEDRVEVRCLERFDPLQEYDLALITVRAAQIMDAVVELARSRQSSIVAVIGNNFGHHAEQAELIGGRRFILGFGSFGGYRDDGVIVYLDGRSSKRPDCKYTRPTTLGVISSDANAALKSTIRWFMDAGLPVTVSTDMIAWLKCHAALVFPLAGAIYACGGDQARTCRTRDALVLGVRACRELFRVLHRLGVKTEPRGLKLLLRAPELLLVHALRHSLAGEGAAVAMFGHANAVGGRNEIAGQARALDALAETSNVPLTYWRALLPYFSTAKATALLADGSRALRLNLW